MKLSDVIALIGAGYNRAEIEAMEAGETPEETPKQEEPKPETPKEPKTETDNSNKELLDAITKLTAAVQSKNIRDSKQPADPSSDTRAEVDKVLLNLYNS